MSISKITGRLACMKVCPICGSKFTKEYIEVNKWKIKTCLDCRILYTVIQNKKTQVVESFYSGEYIAGYTSRELELKDRFWQHLSRIEKYKQGGRLLDIGCSLGFFLQVVEQKSQYSWKIEGIEPNTQLASYAKKGINGHVSRGTISKIPFNKNTFDCITCFDVLEHDFNLQKNLLEVRRVLKKGGIFVVQAPNYKSFMAFLTGKKWDWWAPPDHVLHFSFDYLVRYLRQNGFEIQEKFTYERPKDFLLNVRGAIGKNYPVKALFYLSIPFLLILEWVSWFLNKGALSFIIAKKRNKL